MGASDTNSLKQNTMDFLDKADQSNAAKCCTKKKCNPQPKCTKIKMTRKEFLQYYLLFDVFIVLLRWSIAKPGENKFYLFYWIQIQLIVLYILFNFTIFTYNKSLIIFDHMTFFLSEFFDVVPRNPYFAWMGLNKVHYWLYKAYCLFFFLLNFVGFMVLILFYVVSVIICGPYFLGYYSMKFFL